MPDLKEDLPVQIEEIRTKFYELEKLAIATRSLSEEDLRELYKVQCMILTKLEDTREILLINSEGL